ncbi:bifunctional hydroxymethylpyrimidine kinase/phosphomethylpyrimidine kinase [Castellaniella sp. GW247-6E4]|uniref:bifunctional hydroxymethylpyrimidine kinase/phosphomethylpyrimidine kinase n=1 Tax=Castellaniella sp. GW247-6E4 TaxID=3140380 RepID=UPI003315EAC4
MAQADPSLHAPLPLIVGPFDPSGAGNLPVDAVICAQMGSHALSVATAIHVQDSAGIESIQRLGADLIDDQARCLLEDMAVGAIKIGPLYDPETISILTQIAADYSSLPLVMQLCAPPEISDLEDLDPEETVGAMLELLVPQARIVVVDRGLLEQWGTQGLLSSSRADDPVAALHEFGAPYVVCCNTALSPGLNGLALHIHDQPGLRWPWPLSHVRLGDAEGMLASLMAALLARGLEPVDAIREAVAQGAAMLERSFHPGMGQRLLLHARPQP